VPWAAAPLLAAASLVTPAVNPPSLPLDRVIGQKVVTAFAGPVPSRDLLRRLRAGHVGGVVLFSRNVGSAAQLRRLTRRIHVAAAAGGNPPPLIPVDQEGGLVRRVGEWRVRESAARIVALKRARRAGT
jgi:beta-glucosidase-like glycosyl hydrolase